jgi:hypothetical protein
MILWLKFDNPAIENENSNYFKIYYNDQVLLKKYGNIEKVYDKFALYHDECGVKFHQNSFLEIIGMTHDYSILRNLYRGL